MILITPKFLVRLPHRPQCTAPSFKKKKRQEQDTKPRLYLDSGPHSPTHQLRGDLANLLSWYYTKYICSSLCSWKRSWCPSTHLTEVLWEVNLWKVHRTAPQALASNYTKKRGGRSGIPRLYEKVKLDDNPVWSHFLQSKISRALRKECRLYSKYN